MQSYMIERRPAPRKPWKATGRIVTAKSANAALRAFGSKEAFRSPKVKVVTGSKTGRQYRAVPVKSAA
jgi:hypothetical protein